MKITKYGHACLFIDNGRERLVIDPGGFTDLPADLSSIRTVVVSEEHGDHYNAANLKKILEQSPKAMIFSTKAVAGLLKDQPVPCQAIEGVQTVDQDGFVITLREGAHAPVHGKSPCRVVTVQVGDFLYYPSDSFITTSAKVKVLALPSSGPWYKLTEAIDFANVTNCSFLLATHDGLTNQAGSTVNSNFIKDHVSGKELVLLKPGESKDFS